MDFSPVQSGTDLGFEELRPTNIRYPEFQRTTTWTSKKWRTISRFSSCSFKIHVSINRNTQDLPPLNTETPWDDELQAGFSRHLVASLGTFGLVASLGMDGVFIGFLEHPEPQIWEEKLLSCQLFDCSGATSLLFLDVFELKSSWLWKRSAYLWSGSVKSP